MKLTMTRVLTPLAALAFTLGAQATAVSTDDFESYAAGASMTNEAATAAGWSFWTTNGVPDESVVTTTAVDNKYLKLSTEEGVLFRNVDGTVATNAVELLAGLYVDTDVQFTLTEKGDRPPVTEGANGDKFIIWLEADEEAGATNLCVWAREYKAENGAIVANSNKVYKLASGDIVPGSWHRLTVKACQSINTSPKIPGFQVYLDGSNTPLTSNINGAESTYFLPDDQLTDSELNPGALLDSSAQTLLDARTFFPAMADELESLKQVGFSGEGAIDNLVFTRDVPDFQDPTVVRFDFDMDVIESIDIDSLGVSLMSTNDTVSVAQGAKFTFSINWKTGYSAAMFNTTTSADGYASVEDYEVTANGFGLGVITVTTAAKDTTDVTFTWDALNDAMGEQVTENTAIKFTIGENVYDADILNETSYTITGVKTGTNILVTVTFSNNKWKATIPSVPSCMSFNENTMTLTLNSRPESGTVTVNLSAEAAPPVVTVNGTGYYTLAEALSASATAGQTITFNQDLTGEGAISTAASTIDLNGHKLGTTGITFTGTGAKTLKGGDVVDSYNTITITAPAGENLTLDGVTFHASVTPAGSGDVLLVTNCTFLCDKDTSGNDVTTRGQTIHSYGILFANTSLFGQADVVNNWFAQGRRAAVQASYGGDLYFYGNTVDGSVDTTATGDKTGDVWALYPALQIFSNGRVFIENNTFFGQYLGEAFCIYNKGEYRSTGAAVVFNGNVVSNDVNYLWGIYDVDKKGSAALVDPDLYFGANTVGANVDTEHCVYKAVVDGVDMNGVTYSHTPATLALPTGVATVYDWTHGNAGKMYVSGTGVTGFVDNLNDVAAGDTVTVVPGEEAPAKEGFTFTPGALKNQYAVAAEPSDEPLKPGEQSEDTYASQGEAETAAANVTIAASDAVTTALDGSTGDYLGKFEAKVVAVSGGYKVEVALTAAAETELTDEATTNVAVAVAAKLSDIAASAADSQTSINVTGVVPGFYYSISYGTAVNAINTEGARVLAGSSGSITLQTPAKASGATAGFYRVNVNVAPKTE